ncbi:unnamed protein product [Acanthoscelides obtectus]|uniref:Uncharacterized protein n=1 Tax=Acanthoscelides obtectus TaxID=200917 RepID=A0A9P0L4A8_ACAOB|nr:unnamed protein product [Acanthoscelides obtectus]CAK1619842.1 hypothetical protein AOBTE_LOCUS20 [Acanthoscelides obtectus]
MAKNIEVRVKKENMYLVIFKNLQTELMKR